MGTKVIVLLTILLILIVHIDILNFISFRLAEFTRDHAPHVSDSHLFNLEKLVRKLLEKLSLPVHLLMGPTPPPVTPVTALPSSDEPSTPSTNLQFTSTVPTKQLRCVSI